MSQRAQTDPPGVSRRSEETARLLTLVAAETDGGRRRLLQHQVVLLNRPVAEAVAARYRHRGVDEADLRQTALEGLVKAVERFDTSRDADLLSYAVPVMRGEVQRYFRDLGWMVRPPRSVQEMQAHLTRAGDDLMHELGREPADSELAARLGVDLRSVQQARSARGCFFPTSLDQPVGDDTGRGSTLGDLLAADTDDLAAAEARLVLDRAVARLPDRDRRILRLRFAEELTQREIGGQVGLSQVQVSRALDRILTHLQQVLSDPPGPT